MVDVYLYGKLRRYAVDPRPDQDSVVWLEPQPGETVGTVLERLGIPPDEICHVFLNGALLSTHNAMAPWLRYQRVDKGNELDTSVRAGDRLGLFARDMGLLVV
jgi:hypothetical protein